MTTNHLAKTEIIVFFISGIGNANGKGCVLLESFSSKSLNLSFPKDYQIGEFSKIYSIICISFSQQQNRGSKRRRIQSSRNKHKKITFKAGDWPRIILQKTQKFVCPFSEPEAQMEGETGDDLEAVVGRRWEQRTASLQFSINMYINWRIRLMIRTGNWKWWAGVLRNVAVKMMKEKQKDRWMGHGGGDWWRQRAWWLVVGCGYPLEGCGVVDRVWNAALLVYFSTFCCLLRNGKKATLFLFPCFSLFYLKKLYIFKLFKKK